jgi:hypothetical protein
MPSWVLEDDCLAPGRYLRIVYSGPNPFSAYQSTFGILRKVMEIDPADYQERDFRWDVSEDPRSFYIRIIVEKKMDSKSVIYFEIIMQGNQPADPSKNGNLTILIGAKLKTEYKLDTPFQQSYFYRALLWMYNFFFYFGVRRRYLRLCNDWLSRLLKEYRSFLKLE